MKTSLTLAVGLYAASTAFAASNDELKPKAEATPANLEAEDSEPSPYFATLMLRDDIEIHWGGRLLFDTTFAAADSDSPVAGVDGSEFRRVRIYAATDISKHISAKVEFNFAGGDVALADTYIKYKTSHGAFTVGHHRQPFSISDQTSSNNITFLERASVITAFAPSRDSGISTTNSLGEHGMWSLGVFRPVDSTGDGTGDGDYSVTGRVTHYFQNGDSTTHLGLGVSASSSRDAISVSTRPEVHQSSRAVDTGTGSSDGNTLVGLEYAWASGSNKLQAEYVMNSISDLDVGDGGEDVTFSGYYAAFSRMLTGESYSYNKAGKWNGVKPNEDWEGNGLTGGFEAAIRYSMLDLTDGAFDQETTGITLGLNWYMSEHAKIKTNVIIADADANGADGNYTALVVRFQVAW